MLDILFVLLGLLGIAIYGFFLGSEWDLSYLHGRVKDDSHTPLSLYGCLLVGTGPLLTVGLIPLFGGFRAWMLLTPVAQGILLFLAHAVSGFLGSTRAASFRHLRSEDAVHQRHGLEKLIAFHRPDRDRDVRQAIEESLQSGDGEVAEKAALALHQLGLTNLVAEAFARRVLNPDLLHTGIPESLGTMGPGAAGPLFRLLDAKDTPDFARRAIVLSVYDLEDERVTRALLRALEDPSEEVRTLAVAWVGEHDPPGARDRILRALRDPHPDVRIAAIDAWIELKEPADPLLEASRDPESGVRHKALEGLAELEDPRLAAAALEALREPDEGFRKTAIGALGTVKSAEGVDPLLSLLDDPAPSIRAAAARALGRIGDPRATDRLSGLLGSDPDYRPRREAATSLEALSWTPGTDAEKTLWAAARGDWKHPFAPDDTAFGALFIATRCDEVASEALACLVDLLRTKAGQVSENWLRKCAEIEPLHGPPAERSYEPTPIDAEPLRKLAREEQGRREKRTA